MAGDHASAIEGAPSDARVPVPGDLLADHRVGGQSRILYGHLQLTPAFRHPTGQFTYACLSDLARFCPQSRGCPWRGRGGQGTTATGDNAAPGFLVNPLTDERMELDRFYPPAVAFEFNGPQHYGATGRFSAEDAARQRGRDYMKLGICVEKGITLLIIHPEDLTLESMRQRIGPLLPMRDLAGQEPLMEFLKSISRRYRAAARRGN